MNPASYIAAGEVGAHQQAQVDIVGNIMGAASWVLGNIFPPRQKGPEIYVVQKGLGWYMPYALAGGVLLLVVAAFTGGKK